MGFPKLMIAALRGGAGKTILSMGLIAALKDRGHSVAPFKKGPDYIDAGWLAFAAGRPCYNLDPFLMPPQRIAASFVTHTRSDDIAVVEGNRGIFDGIDPAGSTSSAELAKGLRLPVLLCLDCTKVTRTMAAVVMGCLHFDPQVRIRGVILNCVAGGRHEAKLRQSIEHHTGLPVLGAIARQERQYFPERHMGLVPSEEHHQAHAALTQVCRLAQRSLQLDAILAIAREAEPGTSWTATDPEVVAGATAIAEADRPRIGVFKDAAFQFYYPENIEALVAAGGRIVWINPLSGAALPAVDALYIGGGFPETHAQRLSENADFRGRVKALAEAGLPIYAECGGLMFLGEALLLETGRYPMSGVFPVQFGIRDRPQGHGYTRVTVTGQNPYYPMGTRLKGHEFHYSCPVEWNGVSARFAFTMERGGGVVRGMDGLCYKNVLATYTHVHAAGTPAWGKGLVAAAAAFRRQQS